MFWLCCSGAACEFTMMWFSVGLPLLLQFVMPVCLLAAIAFGSPPSRTRGALAVFAACYILAIGVAGLWLVLPWWMPWLYGGLLAVAVARATRGGPHARTSTLSRLSGVAIVASVIGAVVATGITAATLVGRRAPMDAVDLAFPFTSGTYLVVNGGMSPLISAHLATLNGERFRPYRGQSYGVDLVKIDRLGMRTRGLLPRDPAAYHTHGEPVVSPCTGHVVAASDGAPDMRPPRPDRSHMAGNHVLLECGVGWVLLGHLQRGSVVVRAGQEVRLGERVGRAGNSGNTSEPHLHIHAQRPGTAETPLSGDPLPIRIGGRFLVRNHRVETKTAQGGL